MLAFGLNFKCRRGTTGSYDVVGTGSRYHNTVREADAHLKSCTCILMKCTMIDTGTGITVESMIVVLVLR